MKKTIKQRNLEFLQAHGWREDKNTRVSRYLVLSHPDKDFHYYLGRSGAVRRGRTVGDSVSVKLKFDGAEAEPTGRIISGQTRLNAVEEITPVKAAALLANPGEGIEQAMERAEAEQRSDPTSESGPAATIPSAPSAGVPDIIRPAESEHGPLIDELDKALADVEANTEYALYEAGVEIGRFDMVAAAKHEVQSTWGQGQVLQWDRRMTPGGRRVLVHEQFNIAAVKKRRIIRNWYIKDTGDHRAYMSGLAIPVDSDNVTRNIDFVDCDLHPASHGVFENCAIDGQAVPDGPGCLYDYYNKQLEDRAHA